MGLQGHFPMGVFHNVVHDQWHHLVSLTPFRLKIKFTIWSHFFRLLFCKTKIITVMNDHFQLVRSVKSFRSRKFIFFGRAPGDMVLLVPLVIVMKFVAFEKIFWLGRRGKINKCWPWYVYFVIFINKRKLSSAMKYRLILFFQGGGSGYWFMGRRKR